jgi:tetratricopeptide (TPR) repeat protein
MSGPSTDRLLEMECRVERDPFSLLFAPLAEMYRAAGRLADAERILSRGLERHPEHHSAATALGRVLLEQGRRDEARTVLEGVVARVPDNLLAVRLLADVGAAPQARAPRRMPTADPTPVAAAPPARPRVVPRDTPPGPAQGDRLLSGTLADLYLEQGDREQGMKILRELVRREPESAAWREKLRAAELVPAPALRFPEPSAAFRGAPEPLPEEVWAVGEAEESEDPSTLNLFDARRIRATPAPAEASAPPAITLEASGPREGSEPAPPISSGSGPAPLQRLRSYLAQVERYRTTHAL